MVGVPVRHDDQFQLARGHLLHVRDGGLDTPDVTRLRRPLEDAAVDHDVKRLARVQERNEKEVAEAHAVHAYPDSNLPGPQWPPGRTPCGER